MAVPSYTTDLTSLNTGEATTGWAEPGTWTAGGIPVAETDFFIQGTGCISKTFNATGLGGLVFTAGAGVTIPTDGAFLCWQYFGAPNALDTGANGGIRLIIGSATTAFNAWNLGGSNTYTYGGWQCLAADPAQTADYTVGSPTATRITFGWAANVANAVAKGNPFGCDALRYGRCEARIADGSVADGFATFTGYAATNDNVSNRWGLIQAIDGGFKWQGLMILGHSTAVDFRDSNKSIVIANTTKVSGNFNKIEIRQATSRVDWTNVNITALGTVARGNLQVVDNADVNFETCVFTDMGTFVFLGNSTINGSTFRRCQLVTQGSAVFDNCTFDSTADTVKAMLSNNPANISNCTFVSSGTKHGIEINTAGTYTFSGNIFTGYAAVDGSTGNEAVYNNSGGAVTLNISGGGGTPSIRNGAGASTTINNNISVTFTGMKDNTEIRVYETGTTTEIAGIESATAGSADNRSFTWSAQADEVVDYVIHNVTYESIRVEGFTVPTSDSSIPIQQRVDRVFSNP